jgi:hypothetical protein
MNRRSRWTSRDDGDVVGFMLEHDVDLLGRLRGGPLTSSL